MRSSNGSSGIDRVTIEKYEESLEENIRALLTEQCKEDYAELVIRSRTVTGRKYHYGLVRVIAQGRCHMSLQTALVALLNGLWCSGYHSYEAQTHSFF